jgi:phage tail-like protein
MLDHAAPRFALMQGSAAWQRAAFDSGLALVDGVVQLAWDTQGEGGTPLAVDDEAGGGLAFDTHCRLYHSVPGEGRVERWLWDVFDPAQPQTAPPLADVLNEHAPLPQVFGALPPAPGAEFTPTGPALPGFTPRALACDGQGHLFVLDAKLPRICIVDLAQRRVLRSEAVPADTVHIAWHGRWLWVLARSGAIHRLSATQGLRPSKRVAAPEAARLAFAEDGRAFVLLRAHRADAAVLDLQTQQALAFGAEEPFAFASGLAVSGCGEHQHLVVARRREEVFSRVALQAPYALAEPLTARHYDGQGIAATPDGRIVFWTPKGARHATAARLHYRGRGRLVGFRLDAGEGRNTWGRVLLDACIPAQTQIRVFGLISDDEIEAPRVPRTPPANQPLAAVASPEATPLPLEVMLPADDEEGQPVFRRADGSEQAWLVETERFDTFEALAPPVAGRYLWLVIELIGHSRATPRLRGVRAECPAHPWLQRLPQLYSRHEGMRQFLQRFLAAPAGLDEDLAQQAEQRHALLKPCSTPAAVLPWLAGWLGLVLDERWSETARRSFIREAPGLFRLRGTVWALQRMVEIVSGVPVLIVEQFRLRGLGRLGPDPQGQGWDEPAVLGFGLRVGGPVGNREVQGNGEGNGEAVIDSFARNAHRFTVLVQGEMSADTEAAVRHLLDVHRPAHTLFTLCGLNQGARIGRGLQMGLTTRIGRSGGWRPLQLGAGAVGRGQTLGRPGTGLRPGMARLNQARIG